MPSLAVSRNPKSPAMAKSGSGSGLNSAKSDKEDKETRLVLPNETSKEVKSPATMSKVVFTPLNPLIMKNMEKSNQTFDKDSFPL